MGMIRKRKLILFIALAVSLLLGFTFNLSQAESEKKVANEFELALAQLSETQELLPSPVISMDFQDADLRDVLKVFSQQAGLNFIASENVKSRRVTLYLDKVSVEDALNTIMSANNLSYDQEQESRIFVVKEWGKPEIETITKVFPLQYARVKGYELTESGEREQESKKIGIKEVIERLISEYGRVAEDARTNSLIVTDVPSQFPNIEETIKGLDIKLPQVMIEAEIVEASLDTIDKLGIEWGTSTEGELISAFGAGRTSTYPFTKPQGMGKVGAGGDLEDLGLNLGYVSAMNLGGTLALLKKDTDTKILARPRILTLNNETAEIRITADTAISAEQTEISTGEGIGTAVTSAERTETGITLQVTPQINKANEITMVIEPSVISTKLSTYFPEDFVDPQTRSARTTVTVKNGETIIIGGLISSEDSRSLRKVPFLGDIPLLGNLFRKKDDSSSDKELIIFITPHLLEEKPKVAGLVLERLPPEEYEDLSLREELIEGILDKFEE